MSMFRRLWADEGGFIISAELVLVATLLVIGMIVGLTSLRNQVVQELVDVGQAIGSLSQTYALAGTQKCGVGLSDGSSCTDKADFCQSQYQSAGSEPGGISLQIWPSGAPGYPPGGEQW
jgi:Flp pilus assembly pilin Flp